MCTQCWDDIIICVSESLPGIGCSHDSARPGPYVKTPFMLEFAACNNPAVLCWCMRYLRELQRLCLQIAKPQQVGQLHGAMRMCIREPDHAPILSRSLALITIDYFSNRA